MSINTLAFVLDDAAALLDSGNNDAAIDALRAADTPNDAQSCGLLARAYFQRGDTKGDIYASHYFARRARQLGCDEPCVAAIQAVGAFRKEQFEEAIQVFDSFVTADSPPATKLLYGVALDQCANPWDARVWIESALEGLPEDDPLFTLAWHVEWKGLVSGDQNELGPAVQNMYTTVIETLKASQAKDIEAPFKHNAVSKLRGHGTAAKDFNWVKKNIPCQAACPAGTDIPGYLSAIYQGDHDTAYQKNLWDNVFPAVLGRVCARPCEKACRHGWEGLGEPVAICWSKRSAADFKSRPPVVLDRLYEPTGKRVAVIGAGVAGLAAARNLALLGHTVTVYEKHNKPGGTLNQGIPEFRLPRDIIEREIEQVRLTGVEIICNTEIGKDVSVKVLLENFEAVIMAAGTLRPNMLDLPSKTLTGIRHGLDFLLEVNETQQAQGFGDEVIVIGGGFTAMDCARTAWRLGPQNVRVMYRRGRDEMLITPGELQELEHEGIPMEFFARPVAYLGDVNGRVKAMRFIRTRPGQVDAGGRRRPIDIPGSEFELPCDTVLLATGQFPDTAWIDETFRDLLVGEDDWLKSVSSSLTDHARIFATGDFATGAKSLIDAIGHAKACVQRVDRFLMGEARLFDVVEVSDTPEGSGRIREMDAVPLQHIPTIPVAARALTSEVETGYHRDTSIDEAQRCYLCHYKYEIDIDKCIYCEWCIRAKPRPDCIVRVKDLRYDEQGVIVGFERAQSTEETKMIYINQEDCIRCNACVQACPVDCISVQKVSRKTFTKDGTVLY
jgi:NADPH-dependent glutamate synthase beta subunit-like oxidoreductase/ferredoxin